MKLEVMDQVYGILRAKSEAGFTSGEEEVLLKVLSPENTKQYKDTFFEENPDMAILVRSLKS